MAEIRVKGTGTIKLFESDNTSNVTIASPASLGADRTITLPDADVTLVSGTMSTVALTGSTNNQVTTVTAANAIQGETHLTYDGTILGCGALGSGADLGVGLHIKTADSGASAMTAADELIVENDANSGMTILSGTSHIGGIYFGDSGDTDIGKVEYNHYTNKMAVTTNAVERMNIMSDGTFKASAQTFEVQEASGAYHEINQTTGNVTLRTMNTYSSPYGNAIAFNNAAPDNNSNYFLRCDDNVTLRMIVYSDGDLQNHDNSYGGISDEKLKEQITDATSQWDDIKDLKVRKFKFKQDVEIKGDGDEHWRIGLVAQEAELVSPNLIKDNPDRDYKTNELTGTTTKSIKYSVLYMKAIKALQESMERIEQLEAKVTALENA